MFILKTDEEKYLEKYLIGTIFEIYGSHFASGKSGNHYEVEARDVIFEIWSQGKISVWRKNTLSKWRGSSVVIPTTQKK